MTIDGNYDGKITIQKGQGISQAIRDELGLTQEECNKLGGSIWAQIFQQVEAQNQQGQIYKGGSDLKGPTNKNFVVNPGQVIEFSKEIWNNIVQLVNDKLDKNIEKLESAPKVDPNPPANDPKPANDPNPPANDPKPLTIDPNSLQESYTEKDAKGNIITYMHHYPDHPVNYYSRIEYDDKGNKTKSTFYNLDGSVKLYDIYEYDAEGNAIKWTRYKPDGSVQAYSRDEYDDKGNNTETIYYKSDGSVQTYSRGEYDAEGNLMKWTSYKPDGTINND